MVGFIEGPISPVSRQAVASKSIPPDQTVKTDSTEKTDSTLRY